MRPMCGGRLTFANSKYPLDPNQSIDCDLLPGGGKRNAYGLHTEDFGIG